MNLVSLVLPRVPEEVKDPEARRWMDDITRYLNELNIKTKGIPLNTSMVISIADTGNINTEFEVPHNLNRIPTEVIIVYQDKAGSVYDSGTAWTNKSVFLKFSAANATIDLRVL